MNARFRLWPYLLANAGVATWIDFGRIHRLHSADSIIFSLSSLYEWRPFFWEQDRVGLVWPLLMSWCPNPLASVLVLTGLMVFLGLCLPVLLARVLTKHPAAPALAIVMAALALLMSPDILLETYLVVCNYPGGLTLGLAALLLLDKPGAWRIPVAWLLLFAGCWLYIGIVLYLVPLAVYRGWLPSLSPLPWWNRLMRRSVVLFVLGCGVGCGGVFLLMDAVHKANPSWTPTHNKTLPQKEWPTQYAKSLDECCKALGKWLPLTLVGISVVGLAWGLVRHRKRTLLLMLHAVPLLLAALGEFAYLGTREWVKGCLCHPRYFVAGMCVLGVSALVVSLAPVMGRRRWVGLLACVLLLSAATVRFGWPGPHSARRSLERMAGTQAGVLLDCDVDAVAGGYWTVWPALFDYNLARYERGLKPAVGITLRGGTWMYRWQSTPGRVLRVGVIDDGSAQSAVDQLGQADLHGNGQGLERLSKKPLLRVGRVNVYEYRVRQNPGG
jgi:hypothetical protein